MMRALPVVALSVMLASASAAVAQQAEEVTTETLSPLGNVTTPVEEEEVISFTQVDAAVAQQGVILRVLDKMSGALTDVPMAPDQRETVGRIEISITECRYPIDNPNGDAFAYVTVRDPFQDLRLFEGWMIASSPALNALDHHRYDVWVLRCITS